jgi:dihydroorotate dehydrogenase (fumarate)
MKVDLSSEYLGLNLRTPLVASASPLTGHLDTLKQIEDAGASAVVLPSLFEEQITNEAREVERLLATGVESFAEFHDIFVELEDYNTGPDQYLDLVTKAKEALSIPVIASLNGVSRGGWVDHARLLQEAGADALELNVYFVATDEDMTSSMVELQYLDLVEAVRARVQIPLAVKLSPYFNSLTHMASLLVRSGAEGLVLFNRFYQPDLDLESRQVVPRLVLSSSDELRLPLRWIAILYRRIQASLAATTGVHTAEDALKVLFAGANVAMMTSALLLHGAQHVTKVEGDMVEWLELHDYASVRELRGSMSQKSVADPAQFERTNYMKTLMSYSSEFRG